MKNKILSAAILSVGLITASLVSAQVTSTSGAAQAPTNAQLDAAASGITFPIPELGNCTDRESCRAYCNDLNHMSACVDYAQAHGLASQTEAALAKKYIVKVQNKETPGGCTDPVSCNQYCQSISHLNECLKFAKENGVSDDNITEGQQVINYLNAGGKTPGGCDTKSACEAYCSDFSHVQECMAFAKNAGMVKRLAREQGIPEGQFQKILDLTQAGQTPGGCKSKEECDSYCKDSAHLTECVNFGVTAGFVTQDQADKIIKIGGKGPGGCDSEDACKTYCNDQAHADECFKFAQDNGLISQEDVKMAKEGIVMIKSGLTQAPPEVRACINSVLGPDAIAQIQAGTFVPNQAIGDQLKGCAEKFKTSFNPEDAFRGAPPAVARCLKDKVGALSDKLISGQTAPDATAADAFRTCVSESQLTSGTAGMPNIEGMMRGAPAEVQKCIQDKLGTDFVDKLAKGEAETSDIQGKMKDCFQSFRPEGMMQGTSGSGTLQNGSALPAGIPSMMGSLPPGILDCVKAKLSAEEFVKLSTGEVSSDARDAIKACAMQGVPSSGGEGNGTLPPLPSGTQLPAQFPGAQTSAPGMMPQISCAQFASVPSCDYVPGNIKDICEKCKSGGN